MIRSAPSGVVRWRGAFGIAEKGDAPDGDGQQQNAQPCHQQERDQIDCGEEGYERPAFPVNGHGRS
jgi:hypothetical protein